MLHADFFETSVFLTECVVLYPWKQNYSQIHNPIKWYIFVDVMIWLIDSVGCLMAPFQLHNLCSVECRNNSELLWLCMEGNGRGLFQGITSISSICLEEIRKITKYLSKTCWLKIRVSDNPNRKQGCQRSTAALGLWSILVRKHDRMKEEI